MKTNATLHIHPASAEPIRIFEIRRLARESGCAYIPTKTKPKSRWAHAPFDPNDGGRAA